MAEIVLVHGIDQQQKTADSLENDWLPHLAGGVRIAGFPKVADRIWRDRGKPGAIEARMAYYGNLFLMEGQQGNDAGEFTPEECEFAEDLAMEWLRNVDGRATKLKTRQTAARELAYVTHAMGAEQGRGRYVRRAVNSLANISWFWPYGMGFAESFVNRSLAQVTRYLTQESIHAAALQAATELIGPETKAVIGHSLGSVVAFEAAHLLKQPLPLLLTLGSPLGLQNIVYQRLKPQPPTFPPNVIRWVNIADQDDFIAAEPNLESLFGASKPKDAVFEGGYTVDNGAEPHNSSFYLGKKEVGAALGNFFTSDRTD